MTLTPESAGLDSCHLAGIGVALRNGRLRNLHGVVVLRNGRLVFEQYFTGHDERRGCPWARSPSARTPFTTCAR